MAAGDLVGGVGELQHRPHDPPREVPREQRGDEQAEQPGDREPLDQVVTRWLMSVFGVATTIAPTGWVPR